MQTKVGKFILTGASGFYQPEIQTAIGIMLAWHSAKMAQEKRIPSTD